MKCPNCSTNLLRKERTSSRCKSCRKEFALDPKTNSLLLHDLRLQVLADKLSDGGRLRYTIGQLHHAAARKTLGQKRSLIGCLIFFVVVFWVVGAILLAAKNFSLGAIFLVIGALFLLGTFVRARSQKTVKVPVHPQDFRRDVLGRWRAVYHAAPRGMVSEDGFVDPNPPQRQPRAAVLCPDRSVGVCLVANGIQQQRGVVVVGDLRAVPAAVPVVILHDASVAGCRFTMLSRRALAGRLVVVAGLRPNMVMSAKGALRLRTRVVDRKALNGLRAELHGAELEWLGDGWWVPLASVPPAKVIAATTRAIQRALRNDRDQRRAERVGFMSWPAA